MRAKTINEAQTFTRETDPKETLGIGMMGQLKALAKSHGKNIENMDDVGFFLVAARDRRHDLMDYLLSNGLNINSQDCQILRVIAWWEYIDLGIHLIQKKGADVEKAIYFAKLNSEWKTIRAIEEMKSQQFPIKEDYNFERGVDPKASMDIGGINFQEEFDEIYGEWISSLKKLNGQTITGEIEKYWMNPGGIQKHELKKRSVKVREMDKNASLESMGGGHAINWVIYFYGADGSRYSFDLNQKINIQTGIKETLDFERGMGAKRALEVGGLNFQEGFDMDFKRILDKWFSLLKTLEGKTISAVSIQHGRQDKEYVSEKMIHKIKVQRVLEPGIRPAHIMDKNEESIILSQWVVGEDGNRYELDLRKKIYIENES